jgi:hypothetical protein
MSWLDPQTLELLAGVPPRKQAPSKTAEFGLVLLRKGTDEQRLVRAISRINDCSDATAEALVRRPLPIFVNRDLDYGDVLLGQFELICCDATAAFLNSEVLEQGDPRYLAALFDRIRESPEFRRTALTVVYIPRSDAGERFADQFLGVSGGAFAELACPLPLDVPFKKARIMQHWAAQIGARVESP